MKNFRRINGQIYAGAAPYGKDLEYLKNILKIKTVVSLDETVAEQISGWLKENKIKHIVIPIDVSMSSYNDKLKYLVNNIVRILDNNQPIYIHCLHGQDRTGLAEAIYRIRKLGQPFQQAYSAVKKYNFGAGVPNTTLKLWTNILKLLDNSAPQAQLADDISYADDLVLNDLRNTFDTNHLSPMPLPNGLFSLQEGVDVGAGTGENEMPTKREILEKLYSKTNNVPSVGSHHGITPMKGFAPTLNSVPLDDFEF